MRAALKKNASIHIDELKGFSRFVERNFTGKEKEYFNFMFEERAENF